eukprot:s351_g35.t1
MCAYNQVNGVPSCASSELLRSKLRDEWGFRGMIVTDCDSIADMYSLQRYRDTPAENIEAALAAGTDVACSPGFFREYANASMEPLLTEAVKNALRVRFILGEFDPPPADIPDSWEKASTGHVELAMEAALQGAVLLKNEGHMLPLAAEQRVAVLGPLRNATRSILGNYEAWPVPVAPGPEVGICGAAGSSMPEKPDAEVVVVVAGLTADDLEVQDPDIRPVASEFCKAGCLETEGCDRPNISWPRSQAELIATAATWGIPVVLVVISGGPVDLADYAQMDGIHSILWLGYSGEAAGEALGRLVYGLAYPAKVPPVEARQADIDGWTFFARFSGALWETFIDVATSRGPREQKGWEYRKGIEGMSMGSMAFEMMTTSEDTEEFKELSKEYQSGYGVPFLNLSFRKITAATRDVSAAGNVWFSRVNQTKETKTPVREEFHPELRSEKLKCTSIAAA